MKINWGTGIIIAFGLFMAFILSFVYKVQSNQKYDNELVTEEYYKKEATVQIDIEKKQNANALKNLVVIKEVENGIQVAFPKDFDYSKINGKVSIYKKKKKKLDFEISISLSSTNLLIHKSNLTGGLWDITVDWTCNGIDYLNKETIYF